MSALETGAIVAAVLLGVAVVADVFWRPIPGIRYVRIALLVVLAAIAGRFTGRAVSGARGETEEPGGSAPLASLTARPVHRDSLEEVEAEAAADKPPEPDRSGSIRDRYKRLK